MQRLFKAILARWMSVAGAIIRARMGDTSKGLWLDVAPHGTKYPYVVMSSVNNAPEGSMGHVSNIEVNNLQFNICVDEYQTDLAYTIADDLKTLLDDTNLTFDSGSSGHTLGMRRTQSGRLIQTPDAGDELVIEYKYWYDEK